MKTILLLEDDKNLNRGISLKLEKEGYQVLSAYGVEQARELFHKYKVHMIISDIMLLDGSGLDFCAEVRKSSEVYFLFLTALDTEIDMVTAYDVGADDYVAKPFSLMVLVSKVHAFMRRQEGVEREILRSEDILLNYKEMKVYKEGDPLNLSKKELQLLICLMENAQQVLSKEQILDAVWDREGQFIDENTVPVNISRLRSKVGMDYVQTVRGIGYIWTKECIKE